MVGGAGVGPLNMILYLYRRVQTTNRVEIDQCMYIGRTQLAPFLLSPSCLFQTTRPCLTVTSRRLSGTARTWARLRAWCTARRRRPVTTTCRSSRAPTRTSPPLRCTTAWRAYTTRRTRGTTRSRRKRTRTLTVRPCTI